MKFAEKCDRIFADTTSRYHITDDVDAKFDNPFEAGSIEHTLAEKTGSTLCSGTSRTSYATPTSTPWPPSRSNAASTAPTRTAPTW